MRAEKGLPILLMKFINKEFIRFLIMGALNSLLTYLVYLILIIPFNYGGSYAISYFLGIIFSFYMNTIYVFKEKISIRKMFKFPLVYLVQFLISELFLYLFVDSLNINKRIAPLIVIIISVPLTFILSKYIIKGKAIKEVR